MHLNLGIKRPRILKCQLFSFMPPTASAKVTIELRSDVFARRTTRTVLYAGAAIADVDAVLFVTPEFNRSIPGGLKNAIDWASRPWGQNSFTRKPSGVIGTSPGSIGTAVAQSHLRGVLCFCNSPLMNNVEA